MPHQLLPAQGRSEIDYAMANPPEPWEIRMRQILGQQGLPQSGMNQMDDLMAQAQSRQTLGRQGLPQHAMDAIDAAMGGQGAPAMAGGGWQNPAMGAQYSPQDAGGWQNPAMAQQQPKGSPLLTALASR